MRGWSFAQPPHLYIIILSCRNWNRRAAVLWNRWGKDTFELFSSDSFYLKQPLGDRIQFIAVFQKYLARPSVRVVHETANFLVDLFGHGLGIIPLLRDLSSQEDQFLFLTVYHRSQLLAHAQAGHHRACHTGYAFQIIGSA